MALWHANLRSGIGLHATNLVDGAHWIACSIFFLPSRSVRWWPGTRFSFASCLLARSLAQSPAALRSPAQDTMVSWSPERVPVASWSPAQGLEAP
jgi:hypothetical protein